MKPDRIPCINPRCNRTAAKDKYPEGWEIICGKCWKNIPGRLKDRHKSLQRRRRLILKRWKKEGIEEKDIPELDHAEHRNWADIRNTFYNDKPEGIEEFLTTTGFLK